MHAHIKTETHGSKRTASRRLFRPGAGLIVALAIAGALVSAAPFASADGDREAPDLGHRLIGAEFVVPGEAVDGVLEISIPPGTAESMAAGGRGYILPSVIQLHRGDRIVIHNADIFPHIMLFAFVMPGETVGRTFNEITTETYSAGCTIDPTPNGFTSLFVSG